MRKKSFGKKLFKYLLFCLLLVISLINLIYGTYKMPELNYTFEFYFLLCGGFTLGVLCAELLKINYSNRHYYPYKADYPFIFLLSIIGIFYIVSYIGFLTRF